MSEEEKEKEKASESSGILYNLVTVGDPAVGKTCLFANWTGEKFRNVYITTVGIDKATLIEERDNIKYNIKLWDTTGQERFASLATKYLRKADGVFFVYDVSDRKTFTEINKWLKVLKESNSHDKLQMILIANKIDLERAVNTEEGQKLANDLNMIYCETSAKDGRGVEEAYKQLVNAVIKVNYEKAQKKIIQLQKMKQKKNKSSC